MEFSPFDPFENKESFTLDNGLTVVCLPLPQANQQAFRLVINAGHYHGQNGLAHFTEHLVAHSRNSGEATTLRAELENLGGVWDGGTTTSKNSFYGFQLPIFSPSKIEYYLNRLARYVFQPTFDYDDMVEKGIFQNEYAQAFHSKRDFDITALAHLTNNPQHYWDRFRTRFGNDQIIQSRAREECQGFHKRHYNTNNAILITAGRLPVDTLRELLGHTRMNEDLAPGHSTANISAYQPESPILTAHAFSLPEESNADYTLFHYFPSETPIFVGIAAQIVLREIANNILREKMAISYGVKVKLHNFGDCCSISLYSSGIKPTNLKALQIGIEQLKQSINSPILDEKLARAKDALSTSISATDYTPFKASEEAFNRFEDQGTVAESKQIRSVAFAVTPDQVRQVINPMLSETAWQRWILPSGWQPPTGVPLLDIDEALQRFQPSAKAPSLDF